MDKWIRDGNGYKLEIQGWNFEIYHQVSTGTLLTVKTCFGYGRRVAGKPDPKRATKILINELKAVLAVLTELERGNE